jgi:PKD repeat protein
MKNRFELSIFDGGMSVMKSAIKILMVAFVLAMTAALFSCGGGSHRAMALSNQASNPSLAEVGQPVATWPQSLPVDRLQPWETTDGSGRIVSSINLQSQFVPGVERFQEAGSVSDLGEASSLTSGSPGSRGVSWAYYRIPMGADQPGTIAADVNLRLTSSNIESGYYLGIADYSVNTWHWYGPFNVPHVRLPMPSAAYTSSLGNLFLAVVAYDGADFDLVGLGVNARDVADTTAPATPAAPTLTAEAGGVLAEWVPVAEADLAGYRLYVNGHEALGYIEGGTNNFILATGSVSVTVSSIDVSGNESPQSEAASSLPITGTVPVVQLTTSAASGKQGDIIALTASGADSYDWDVNGDGTWDTIGDTTGSAFAGTSNIGIIRPALRAHATGNGFWMGAVSFIVAGNSRPVVSVSALPQQGVSPLTVNFTITAVDDDGTIAEYAWDFEGDGIYDVTSPADPSPLEHVYSTAGLFNPKFRVTDNKGSWDVTTVAVLVSQGGNNPPVAALTATPDIGNTPLAVTLDASGSFDPDAASGDSIVKYTWDIEGDGVYDRITFGPFLSVTYDLPGIFSPTVMVEDTFGALEEATTFVNVSTLGNTAPTASIFAMPLTGDFPLTVAFDATGSTDTDGTIVRYDWDFDGDGNYEIYNGITMPSWTYYIPGNYDARVRVTDNGGAQGTSFVTISVTVPNNVSPTASLTPATDAGNAPYTVAFDATGSNDPDGSIVRYDYDFNGDGIWEAFDGPSTISWTYTVGGTFTARLRVTDNRGAQANTTSTITITVPNNIPPTASLLPLTASGTAPYILAFDATGSTDTDGTIIRYDYDFNNDGIWDAYDSPSTITWTYTVPGAYTAKLRVTDNMGAQASATSTIAVN